jgi:uncharacterized protein (TIGR00730 family)
MSAATETAVQTGLTVCVFCGANPGTSSRYVDTAAEAGRVLAAAGARIAYGGAVRGLMGALADGALAAGGTVVGVVPALLPDGDLHRGLAEMHVVPGMSERKDLLIRMSDAFLVLPGGVGTLDELFEVVTLRLLGAPIGPIVLLDVDGFFTPLLRLLEHTHRAGFLLKPGEEVVTVVTDLDEAVRSLSVSCERRCEGVDDSAH